MYHFAFYFFYKFYYRKSDAVFTAILGTGIIICLHILTMAVILSYFGIIGKIPVFSKTYLYNKLAWYPFIAVLLALVFLYFNKARVNSIKSKYGAKEDFYTFGNIILFILLIAIPSLLIAKFKN
jgi:hypothetical protein